VKSFITILVVFLSTFELCAFPQLSEFRNSPILVFDNKKQAVLKKNLFLKSPFAVVTADSDQLSIKINTFDLLTVYEKSKIQVIEFLDETGFVSDLYLLDGQIRYTVTHRGVGSGPILRLKTPFFDLPLASLSDFIVSLDMKVPSVEIKIISGALPVEFFAYEKKLTLKEGESIKFVGALADDDVSKIKYDYLLSNKKTPKGKLLEVEKFDISGFLELQKKEEVSAANKKKAALALIAEKKRKQKAFEDSFLCKKPFGNLNQCVWWLETGKCYRKRCNASGRWGDLTERPISSLIVCKLEPLVADCDY
jgi:hypothetical protein